MGAVAILTVVADVCEVSDRNESLLDGASVMWQICGLIGIWFIVSKIASQSRKPESAAAKEVETLPTQSHKMLTHRGLSRAKACKSHNLRPLEDLRKQRYMGPAKWSKLRRLVELEGNYTWRQKILPPKCDGDLAGLQLQRAYALIGVRCRVFLPAMCNLVKM